MHTLSRASFILFQYPEPRFEPRSHEPASALQYFSHALAVCLRTFEKEEYWENVELLEKPDKHDGAKLVYQAQLAAGATTVRQCVYL